MKKIIYMVVIIMAVIAISACSSNQIEEPAIDLSEIEENEVENYNFVEESTEVESVEEEEVVSQEVEETVNEENIVTETNDISVEEQNIDTQETSIESDDQSLESNDGIDVDLTQLSATMVYAEVYNIMVNPDEYIGKTIKMSGVAYDCIDPNTEFMYYYCVITDATACCVQGIEYVLKEEYTEYPVADSQITVVGEFETYYEYDILYCRLKNAELQ